MFRAKFIDASSKRLNGVVILATPFSSRLYSACCISVLATSVLFLCLATYTRHESVIGWLVPHGGLIQVDANAGGTLTKILVHEGEAVRAGAPIAQVRLGSTLSSGQNAGTAAREALSAEAAAIAAGAAASEQKLLTEQAELPPKLADLKAEILQDRQQIGLQQQQIALAREDLDRFQRLAIGGDIAPRLVQGRQSNLLSQQQTLARMKGELSAAMQQSADLIAQLHAIPAELAEARASEAQARAQVAQKQVETSAAATDVVVASVSGKVLAVPVSTGQSLAPGSTIAIIEPKNARLEAELYAPSRAIGFIRAGEAVRLMYQAFPHATFGTAKGKIVSFSHTILAPRDVAIPGQVVRAPVFQIRADIARQTINAYGQAVPLQPGMLLTADVVLERRTLFEWLFDPIYAAIK
jgi:membrane fusion protein